MEGDRALPRAPRPHLSPGEWDTTQRSAGISRSGRRKINWKRRSGGGGAGADRADPHRSPRASARARAGKRKRSSIIVANDDPRRIEARTEADVAPPAPTAAPTTPTATPAASAPAPAPGTPCTPTESVDLALGTSWGGAEGLENDQPPPPDSRSPSPPPPPPHPLLSGAAARRAARGVLDRSVWWRRGVWVDPGAARRLAESRSPESEAAESEATPEASSGGDEPVAAELAALEPAVASALPSEPEPPATSPATRRRPPWLAPDEPSSYTPVPAAPRTAGGRRPKADPSAWGCLFPPEAAPYPPPPTLDSGALVLAKKGNGRAGHLAGGPSHKKRARVLRDGALTLALYGPSEAFVWQTRAAHFTATMRGVLGDRRPVRGAWRGSVLDSVVGVFLTQNVSDFLSSKAYMQLAARWPGGARGAGVRAEWGGGGGVSGLLGTGRECSCEPAGGPPPPVCAECGGHPGNPAPLAGRDLPAWRGRRRSRARAPAAAPALAGAPRLEASAGAGDPLPNYDAPGLPPAGPEEDGALDHIDWPALAAAPASAVADAIRCRGLHHLIAGRLQGLLRWVATVGPGFAAADAWVADQQAAAARAAAAAAVRAGAARAALERAREGRGGDEEWLPSPPTPTQPTPTAAPQPPPPTPPPPSPPPRHPYSMEWLRGQPPEAVRSYLMAVDGIGRKSAACVTLLALRGRDFPVDTNVGRICARLGWVPLESEHALESLDEYAPEPEVHRFLHARLMHFHPDALHELHYHMITLGKVFCSKRAPNCCACPLRPTCEYARADGARATPQGMGSAGSVAPSPATAPVAAEGAVPTATAPTTPPSDLLSLAKTRLATLRTPAGALAEVARLHAAGDRMQETADGACGEAAVAATPVAAAARLVERAAAVLDAQDMLASDAPATVKAAALRARYLAISVAIHPDKCAVPGADRAFAALQEAHRVLVDHVRPELEDEGEGEGEGDDGEGAAFPDARGRARRVAYRLPDHLTASLIAPALLAQHALCRDAPFLVLPLPGGAGRATGEGAGAAPPTWRAPRGCESVYPIALENSGDDDDFVPTPPAARTGPAPPRAAGDDPPPPHHRPPTRLALLVPVRTAMCGRFPLAGTYFQTNEYFLDRSSLRAPLRMSVAAVGALPPVPAHFGLSVVAVCRGMRRAQVAALFTRSALCVRSYEPASGAPASLPEWLLSSPAPKQKPVPWPPPAPPPPRPAAGFFRPARAAWHPPLALPARRAWRRRAGDPPLGWHPPLALIDARFMKQTPKLKQQQAPHPLPDGKRTRVATFAPIAAALKCGRCKHCLFPDMRQACLVARANAVAAAAEAEAAAFFHSP